MKSHFSQSFIRSQPSSEGFSLLEVLVSVLMIAGFLATAMQALISATAIKVRSEEISEATIWMQEDLEALKFEANRLDFDPTAGTNGEYMPETAACAASEYANELVARMGQLELQVPAPPYAANSQPRSSSIGDRDYILARRLEANDNMLAVDHEVYRDTNRDGTLSNLERVEDNRIGQLYSEIIPDAAFYCEQG